MMHAILCECGVLLSEADPALGQLWKDEECLVSVKELNCNYHMPRVEEEMSSLQNCINGTLEAHNMSNSLADQASVCNAIGVWTNQLGRINNCNLSISGSRALRAVFGDGNISVNANVLQIYLSSGSNVSLTLKDAHLVISPDFKGNLYLSLENVQIEAHGFYGILNTIYNSSNAELAVSGRFYDRNAVSQICNVEQILLQLSADMPGEDSSVELISTAFNLTDFTLEFSCICLRHNSIDFAIFNTLNNSSRMNITGNATMRSALTENLMLFTESDEEIDNYNISVTYFFDGVTYLPGKLYNITIYEFSLNVSQPDNQTNATFNSTYDCQPCMQNCKALIKPVGTAESTGKCEVSTPDLTNSTWDFDYEPLPYAYGEFSDSSAIRCKSGYALNTNTLECYNVPPFSQRSMQILYYALFAIFLALCIIFLAFGAYYASNRRCSDERRRVSQRDISEKLPSVNLDEDTLLSQNVVYTEDVIVSKRPDTFQQVPLAPFNQQKNYGFRQIPDMEDSSDEEDYMKLINEEMKIQEETVKDVYKGEELYDDTNIFRYTMKNKGRERLQRVTLDPESGDGEPTMEGVNGDRE